MTQGDWGTNLVSLEGEFSWINFQWLFFLSSAGIRCTPLTITVQFRREIFARLTDRGFQPAIICVEAGESVKWSWSQCETPHHMYKAEYCRQHCGLRKADTGWVLNSQILSLLVNKTLFITHIILCGLDLIKNLVSTSAAQKLNCLFSWKLDFNIDEVEWLQNNRTISIATVYLNSPFTDLQHNSLFQMLRSSYKPVQPSNGVIVQQSCKSAAYWNQNINVSILLNKLVKCL